jgi:hypothetical protein
MAWQMKFARAISNKVVLPHGSKGLILNLRDSDHPLWAYDSSPARSLGPLVPAIPQVSAYLTRPYPT